MNKSIQIKVITDNRKGCFPGCLFTELWDVLPSYFPSLEALILDVTTVKPVYNDHLYNEIYYLWFIQ